MVPSASVLDSAGVYPVFGRPLDDSGGPSDAQTLMALVVQNMDAAAMVVDHEGRIEWANAACCRLLSLALSDMLGCSVQQLLNMQKVDLDEVAEVAQSIQDGKPFGVEWRLSNQEGDLEWARLDGKPLRNDQGQLGRFLLVQSNVTAKRQRESRLELHHGVIQMLSEAVDVGQALPRVLKMIGTHLGWPLGIAWEVKTKRWVGDVDMRCASFWPSHEPQYIGYLTASEQTIWRKGEGLIGSVWQARKALFISDLCTAVDPARCDVAEREGVQAALILPILSGDRVTYLLEFAGPKTHPLDHETQQLLEGICRQVSQFIERKRDEMRLRQFMTEFDSLFKLSPDGFVVFNAEGVRSYGNPAFYAMTGLSRERLDGVSEADFDSILRSICSPDCPPRSMAEVAQSDESDQLQLVLPRPAILQRSVRDMHDMLGRYIGRAVYLRDITREIEVDRMKSEFLSTAAHELRTPMVSVHGFTELLLKRKFSEEKRHNIYETIYRQSTLLINMVTELLDLARIESRSGKDFYIHAVDLRKVMKGVIDGFLFPGDQRQVQCRLRPDMPKVFADENHLSRALTNILSNAYKYSPQGGRITLDIVEREVEMGPQVGIRITDEGIGMRPEQLARVCERFYRADPSGNIPGTGLGMSLVKEIMTLMGGAVELQSQFGKGTEVTLWLRVVTHGLAS